MVTRLPMTTSAAGQQDSRQGQRSDCQHVLGLASWSGCRNLHRLSLTKQQADHTAAALTALPKRQRQLSECFCSPWNLTHLFSVVCAITNDRSSMTVPSPMVRQSGSLLQQHQTNSMARQQARQGRVLHTWRQAGQPATTCPETGSACLLQPSCRARMHLAYICSCCTVAIALLARMQANTHLARLLSSTPLPIFAPIAL